MNEQQAIERIAKAMASPDTHVSPYGRELARKAWNEMKAIARDDLRQGLLNAGRSHRMAGPHVAALPFRSNLHYELMPDPPMADVKLPDAPYVFKAR
jgi:hypothetical protein